MKPRSGVGRMAIVAGIVVAVVGVGWFVMRGLAHGKTAVADVPVQTIQRQDLQVTIEATGTVEPIDLVEVKSKASGQILRMPVQVGSVVKTGDLLAQIDKVDVQNQYDQAYAALRAAQAKADISQAQKKRSDDLYAQGILTVDEHETATLDYANAQSSLVTARTNLDTARQRLADATVRAPISGTVLDQLVSVGQVIASATTSVSGGTSLLQMADLSRIRLRALVAETDIGSVSPGQTATVTVDAFPQHPFSGRVEKIEPQAVVQQSVTMFPVLISIGNEQGLLLPGMNGEVSMLIGERDNVLAVPIDALRTARELPAIAKVLGLPADSIVADVRRQIAARAARAASDTSRSPGGGSARGAFGDPAAAGAPGARQTQGAGGAWAGRGANGGRDSAARARWKGRGAGGATGGAGGAGAGAGNGAGAGSGGGNRAQVVFVKTPGGLVPRLVRIGLSNYDFAQVLEGLKEGDEVAMLAVAEIQAKRQDDQSQMRQRMSSGMPGVAAGGARGGAGGGAGSASGNRSGGH